MGKKVNVINLIDYRCNPTVKENVLQSPDTYLNIKLQDLLDEVGLNRQQLSKLTGLRMSSISDICNGKNTQVNITHLLSIMNVLKITDPTKIIDIEYDKQYREQAEAERELWTRMGIAPQYVTQVLGEA